MSILELGDKGGSIEHLDAEVKGTQGRMEKVIPQNSLGLESRGKGGRGHRTPECRDEPGTGEGGAAGAHPRVAQVLPLHPSPELRVTWDPPRITLGGGEAWTGIGPTSSHLPGGNPSTAPPPPLRAPDPPGVTSPSSSSSSLAASQDPPAKPRVPHEVPKVTHRCQGHSKDTQCPPKVQQRGDLTCQDPPVTSLQR